MSPILSVDTALVWILLAHTALYISGIIWFLSGMKVRRASDSVAQPFVSIVVAARDEQEHIAACLQSLLAQDYGAYEIVVVDDGSRDETANIVRHLCGEHRRLQLVERTGEGSKKAALSLAIARARGEILLMTDADCLVGPGWVRGMVSHFSADVGFVIGFSQIGSPGENLGWRGSYEAIDFLNLMACIWGSTGRGHAMAASGQNLAYRRCVYDEVGGFSKVIHRASGDDVLLMQMVRNDTNWRIVFAADRPTFSVHPRAVSWRSLLAQRSRWASNVPMIARMDPLFFLYMIVTYILSWFVVAAPLIWWMEWVPLDCLLGVLAVKWCGEVVLFSRVLHFAKRVELRRFWPLWALLQPWHIAIVGGLGPLGLFSWKGRKHRWRLAK